MTEYYKPTPKEVEHYEKEIAPGLKKYRRIERVSPTGIKWPERDDPEDWLSSRMSKILRLAKNEWSRRGEIEPWGDYLYTNFPDVAAYYAKKQYERGKIVGYRTDRQGRSHPIYEPQEETWEDWFAKRYPSLARGFGWEAPERERQWKTYGPYEEKKKAEETWWQRMMRAGREAPKIKTVGF